MIPVVMATAAPTVSGVLTDISSVVTQAMDWAGNVATMIVSTPILLIFVSFAAVGLGIGLIRRMISV